MNKKHSDTAVKNRRAGRSRFSLRTLTTALVLVAGSLQFAGEAQAQRVVQISGAKRTATVNVSIGKSADVHADASFTDITVGDPEVADVNVLTDRSLSILGKKSGTTRVTVYG
ncbi:MAG: pilus assembly protein CpaC, partial [Bradyrhizobium sp.]|nr:pilus assembly protein CpaC [Bradyrhizobium sp.]